MTALLVAYLSTLNPAAGWTERTYLVPARECVAKAVQIRQRVVAGKVRVFCGGRRI